MSDSPNPIAKFEFVRKTRRVMGEDVKARRKRIAKRRAVKGYGYRHARTTAKLRARRRRRAWRKEVLRQLEIFTNELAAKGELWRLG